MSAGGLSDVLREMAEGRASSSPSSHDREATAPPRPAKAREPVTPVNLEKPAPVTRKPAGEEARRPAVKPVGKPSAGEKPAGGAKPAPAVKPSSTDRRPVAPRPSSPRPAAGRPTTGLKRHAAVVLLAGAVVTLLPAVWAVLFYVGVPVFERARQEPESASRMALAMLLACVPVALLLLAGAGWYHLQHAAAKRRS